MARSSPCDMTLETCQQYGLAWCMWELMNGVKVWRDIHGLVYPDGSVRDPADSARACVSPFAIEASHARECTVD